MGDRPVPNIGMKIIGHRIQIISIHKGRQETDKIHQNDFWPGVQNDSNKGRGVVLVGAGAKMEELTREPPFHLNKGHVARQEHRRDEDDGLGAVQPIRQMVYPGFRFVVCIFLLFWLIL